MSVNPTIEIGNGNWAVKDGKLLGYRLNEQSGYKPVEFDFTRATKATRVNKEGLIEEVAENIPRIDYSNDENGELLVEPPRTNNFIRSINLGIGWSYSRGVIEPTTEPSILFGENFTKLTPEGDGVVSKNNFLQQNTSLVSGLDYVYSVYVKAAGYNFIQLTVSTGFSGTEFCNFDLENGVLGNNNLVSATAKIESTNLDGVYRISLKATSSLTGSGRMLLCVLDENRASRVPPFIADGVSGVLATAFQFEKGSYPTSYIPTEGSAVSRSGDRAPTQLSSSVASNTETTVVAEIASTYSTDVNVNRINWYSQGGSGAWAYTGGTIIFYTSAGNFIKSGLPSNTLFRGVTTKHSFRFGKTVVSMFFNGQKEFDQPITEGYNILYAEFFSTYTNSHRIKSYKIYNKALSDNELIALTS